jgi:hypothetical protein
MASLRPRIARMAATNAQQARQLHMTGPATFPTPLLTTERATAGGVPRDLAALRSECRQRNLPTTGSKAEVSIPIYPFPQAEGSLSWRRTRVRSTAPRETTTQESRWILECPDCCPWISHANDWMIAHCSPDCCGRHFLARQLWPSLQHLACPQGRQGQLHHGLCIPARLRPRYR